MLSSVISQCAAGPQIDSCNCILPGLHQVTLLLITEAVHTCANYIVAGLHCGYANWILKHHSLKMGRKPTVCSDNSSAVGCLVIKQHKSVRDGGKMFVWSLHKMDFPNFAFYLCT